MQPLIGQSVWAFKVAVVATQPGRANCQTSRSTCAEPPRAAMHASIGHSMDERLREPR